MPVSRVFFDFFLLFLRSTGKEKLKKKKQKNSTLSLSHFPSILSFPQTLSQIPVWGDIDYMDR